MGYLEQEELIGHAALRGFLARSLKNSRHHAYLLAGPAHLGKDAIARAAVAEELGRPVKEWADLAGHPDVRVIAREEGDKNISIDALRSFIGHFSRSALWGGRKVGVILGAHELSLAAANALLKTLEEPAGKALLVLTADSLDSLPETVRSRCQLCRFLPVPHADIKKGLLDRGLSEPSAEAATVFSAGRPGLAIIHAEDAAVRERHAADTAAFLAIASAPVSVRLTSAGGIVAKSENPELLGILDSWIGVLRSALGFKMTGIRASEAVSAYASKRSLNEIAAGARAAAAAKRLISENVNPRLVFENLVLTI